MSKKNPKVDAFISKAENWQSEFKKLRAIALAAKLDEELKWGKPCYTFDDNNVVILQGFKEYCAVLFPKGALLKDAKIKDAKGLLEKPGENSRIGRRIRFSNAKAIDEVKTQLTSFIKQAIEVEKAGLKVEVENKPEPLPAELNAKFKQDPDFKAAFKALTPGRQRGYILHFSSAKQAKTREARIEKYLPKIMAGKGLQE